MIKNLLENVSVGILDCNGKFILAPFMRNIKLYLMPELSEEPNGIAVLKIESYDILESENELVVNVTCLDGNEYKINSFSSEFIEYLNKFNGDVLNFIVQCKTKPQTFLSGCKISELSILTKHENQEIFAPPIKGLKLRGAGRVLGHRYQKNGPGRTSRLNTIDFSNRLITSERNVYEVASISKEYEEYLMNTLSEVETVLEYFSK